MKKNLERDTDKMAKAMGLLEIDDWEKELGQMLELLEKVILEMPTLPGADVTMVENDDAKEVMILWDDDKMEYTDVGDDEMITNQDVINTEQPESGLYSMCTVRGEVCTTGNRLCTHNQVLEVDCTQMDGSPQNEVFEPETPNYKQSARVNDRILSKHGQGAIHVSYKQHEDPLPTNSKHFKEIYFTDIGDR